MSLAPGTLVNGRYKILRQLGEGGFGAVYLAEDMRLGSKRVAVKERKEDGSLNSAEAQRQFNLEAELLAKMDHIGLPRVTDSFVERSGRQFLVMDFIEGDDLQDLVIKAQRPLAEQEAAKIMLQVCEAVAYLHEQRPQPIIHSDIKPPNIKITRDGRAVLVDFGIAKVYHQQKSTVKVAKAVSPHFSPPEQHGGKTDTRSDVYSLGATLYCLVCADLPPDALDRLTGGIVVTPPTRKNRSISPAMEQIVMHSLELDPNRRFTNAMEMAQALRAFLGGQFQQVTPPLPVGAGAKCPRCGKVNRSGARFCAVDGTPLTITPAPVASPPAINLPPAVQFEVANAHARGGDLAQAIAAYQVCLSQGFQEAAVYHNLGLVYLQAKQPAEAQSVLSRGTALYPQDPELQFQLARAFADLNQISNALLCAERACKLNPKDVVNLRLYAALLMDVKRYAEAIKQLEQAARLSPNDEINQVMMGRAYFLNNQDQKAIPCLQKALRLKSDLSDAHFIIGVCYHRQKKQSEAARSLNESLRLDSSNSLAHYFLGEVLLQQDKFNEAIVSFTQAARFAPDDPDPHARMAVCYALTDRRSEALRALQNALALNPNHQGARELLQKLK